MGTQTVIRLAAVIALTAGALEGASGPMRVTVISADGHEKSKDFDGGILGAK